MGLYGQSGFKNDFAPSYAGGVGTMVDGQGTTHTVTPAGGTALQFQQSNLGFGTQVANAMRSSVSTQLSQSQESAWQKTAAYGQSLAANYGNMERFINQTSSGVGVGKEFRTQDGTSVQKEFGELTAIANNFASKYGVSHDQAVAMIGTAGIGGNIPLTNIGGEIKAQFSNQDTLQRAWTEAQQINDQTNFSERYQSLSSAVQSEATRISSEQNNALAKEVSSGLSQQTQYRDETQANHREVDQWQQAKSRVDDQSFSFQGDVGMAVRRFMHNEQGLADAEIDTLIHRHNMGDTSATAKLSDTVSQFAEQHGKDLAGIHGTPTQTIIESNSEIRFNEMSQNTERVQYDRTVNTGSVINLAQKSETPTSANINEKADSTMKRSSADINKTHARIDHGKAGNSEEESAIHEVIDEKQRVYSAGSAPSIHETIDKVKTKLTNKFSELFE